MDKASNIAAILYQRLSRRDLSPLEAQRLVKDAINIIRDGRWVSADSVNFRLINLGWKEQALDKVCFELIVYLVENEYEEEIYV